MEIGRNSIYWQILCVDPRRLSRRILNTSDNWMPSESRNVKTNIHPSWSTTNIIVITTIIGPTHDIIIIFIIIIHNYNYNNIMYLFGYYR